MFALPVEDVIAFGHGQHGQDVRRRTFRRQFMLISLMEFDVFLGIHFGSCSSRCLKNERIDRSTRFLASLLPPVHRLASLEWRKYHREEEEERGDTNERNAFLTGIRRKRKRDDYLTMTFITQQVRERERNSVTGKDDRQAIDLVNTRA